MVVQAEHGSVEITEAMIAAGRATILCELTHPERDDIGPYSAAYVAKAVFKAMLGAQQHPRA